jgi:hypothetical protein
LYIFSLFIKKIDFPYRYNSILSRHNQLAMTSYPSDKQVLYASSLARKRNIGLTAMMLQDKTTISKFIKDSIFILEHLTDYTDLYIDGMTVADAIKARSADPREIKSRALAHLRMNELDVRDLYTDGMTVDDAIKARSADPREIKSRALTHLRMNELDVSDLYTDGMTVDDAIEARSADPREIKSRALAHLRINGSDVTDLYTHDKTTANIVKTVNKDNKCVKARKTAVLSCQYEANVAPQQVHGWGPNGCYGPAWGSNYTGD